MKTIQTKVRRWGNSLGVVLPKETIVRRKIKENQEISIIVVEDSGKVLKESFGALKGKLNKSSQKMKDEFRRELY